MRRLSPLEILIPFVKSVGEDVSYLLSPERGDRTIEITFNKFIILNHPLENVNSMSV